MLAAELISAGAKVTFIYGPGRELPPKGVKLVRVETSQEMFDAVKKEMKQEFDIVILAAAVSDYIPEKMNVAKIKSDQNKILLKLQRAPKIIDQIKKIQKSVFLVGFKAETNLSKEELVREAKRKLKESDANLMIANDIGLKKYKNNSDYNNVIVVDSKRTVTSGWKNKSGIVRFIRKEIESRIQEIN